MKKSRLLGAVCACVYLLCMKAQASLLVQTDGTIYDSDLDIYWLPDANLAASNTFGIPTISATASDGTFGIRPDGTMTWHTAISWIAAMNENNYLGHSDWVLPSMDLDNSGIPVDCATASSIDCLDNQYGYMFWKNGVTSTSQGLFNNVVGFHYWSNSDPSRVWVLNLTSNGSQQHC